MKLKKQIIINPDNLKEKKFASVPDFVRWALQVNGVDYDKFKKQMTAINEFKEDQSYSYKRLEVYQTLFVDNSVGNLQFLPDEFAVEHETKHFNRDLTSFKISVKKSADKAGVILNLTEKVDRAKGRAKEELTTLHFSDNHLTLESKYNAELGSGKDFNKQDLSYNNYARDHINYEFDFDETNQITHYSYYRCNSENANWNRSQMMNISKIKDEMSMTK